MMDLNADIGEGYDDAALVPYLTRVSIACGGHAGDPGSMMAALRLAQAFGVMVGAHPSYPDRARFGRCLLPAQPEEIRVWVTQQTETLAEQAACLGMRLGHVKPHGALYNAAARDLEVADAIVGAIADLDPALQVVGLSASRLVSAARLRGLVGLDEAFVDRRYHPDGSLVSRETAGALLTDPAEASAQAAALATGRPVISLDGDPIVVVANTLCVHGDTPNALNILRAVHASLNRG